MAPAVRDKVSKRPVNHAKKPAIWEDVMIEVNNTFRRVAQVKHSRFTVWRDRDAIRSGPTLSRNRMARMQRQAPLRAFSLPSSTLREIENNRSQLPFVSLNHLQNLRGMCRRINAQSSITERRKNPHDPSLYPVYIRRPVLLKTASPPPVASTVPPPTPNTPRVGTPVSVSRRTFTPPYSTRNRSSCVRIWTSTQDLPFAYMPPKFTLLLDISNHHAGPLPPFAPRACSACATPRPGSSRSLKGKGAGDLLKKPTDQPPIALATPKSKQRVPAIRKMPIFSSSLPKLASDRTHDRSSVHFGSAASAWSIGSPFLQRLSAVERPPSRCTKRPDKDPATTGASSEPLNSHRGTATLSTDAGVSSVPSVPSMLDSSRSSSVLNPPEQRNASPTLSSSSNGNAEDVLVSTTSSRLHVGTPGSSPRCHANTATPTSASSPATSPRKASMTKANAKDTVPFTTDSTITSTACTDPLSALEDVDRSSAARHGSIARPFGSPGVSRRFSMEVKRCESASTVKMRSKELISESPDRTPRSAEISRPTGSFDAVPVTLKPSLISSDAEAIAHEGGGEEVATPGRQKLVTFAEASSPMCDVIHSNVAQQDDKLQHQQLGPEIYDDVKTRESSDSDDDHHQPTVFPMYKIVPHIEVGTSSARSALTRSSPKAQKLQMQGRACTDNEESSSDQDSSTTGCLRSCSTESSELCSTSEAEVEEGEENVGKPIYSGHGPQSVEGEREMETAVPVDASGPEAIADEAQHNSASHTWIDHDLQNMPFQGTNTVEEVEELGTGEIEEDHVCVKYSADAYSDFKSSMMQIIKNEHLDETMNEEHLGEVFQYYIDLNPHVHHHLLFRVIYDIKRELTASAAARSASLAPL